MFNTMLLRAVVLLFLCVSAGMCATLGHYQMQPVEEEVPHVDSVAVTDGVAAEEAAAPADTQLDNSAVVEEPAAPADTQLDNSAAVEEEPAAPADTQLDNSAAVEEPAVNSISGDNILAEILPTDTPSADEPKADVPVADVPEADGATAEEPEADSEKPAGDHPAMEAVIEQQPPPTEAEEDNDIRPIETNQSLKEPVADEDDNSWSFNSIRNSFQSIHGYFGSLVELAGGQNGVCQYRCRHGEPAQPRAGFQLPEPNGCSSSLVGFQLDLGIPAMTTCCNQLDVCYDTCGTNKDDCDSEFRLCLHGICADLKKSLGFVSKVQACESMADALHSTVGTLGCRPYMNSQRAACVCEGEERDEL